jgi:hypothetical protein
MHVISLFLILSRLYESPFLHRIQLFWKKTTLLGLVDLYTRVDLIVFIPVQNFADFCLLMLLMRHDCYLNGLTGS